MHEVLLPLECTVSAYSTFLLQLEIINQRHQFCTIETRKKLHMQEYIIFFLQRRMVIAHGRNKVAVVPISHINIIKIAVRTQQAETNV